MDAIMAPLFEHPFIWSCIIVYVIYRTPKWLRDAGRIGVATDVAVGHAAAATV